MRENGLGPLVKGERDAHTHTRGEIVLLLRITSTWKKLQGRRRRVRRSRGHILEGKRFNNKHVYIYHRVHYSLRHGRLGSVRKLVAGQLALVERVELGSTTVLEFWSRKRDDSGPSFKYCYFNFAGYHNIQIIEFFMIISHFSTRILKCKVQAHLNVFLLFSFMSVFRCLRQNFISEKARLSSLRIIEKRFFPNFYSLNSNMTLIMFLCLKIRYSKTDWLYYN